jgi:hypothetical protein
MQVSNPLYTLLSNAIFFDIQSVIIAMVEIRIDAIIYDHLGYSHSYILISLA